MRNVVDDTVTDQPLDLNLNSTLNNISGEIPSWFAGGYGDVLSESDFLPSELPESVRRVFVVIYTVIIVLGLGGNSITALVVGVNHELRTVTNVFLVSLAASDALIAGVNMPLQLQLIQLNNWSLGETACKLGAYVQGVVIVASIFTLISLAVDR